MKYFILFALLFIVSTTNVHAGMTNYVNEAPPESENHNKIVIKEEDCEPTPEPTTVPSETPAPTVAPTVTPEPTVAPTVTPEPTTQPTSTPEVTSTPQPTVAPSTTPTVSPTATASATVAPTNSPTNPPSSGLSDNLGCSVNDCSGNKTVAAQTVSKGTSLPTTGSNTLVTSLMGAASAIASGLAIRAKFKHNK